MRAVIAEDEKFTREELVFMLHHETDVEVCGTASNGEEFLSLCRVHQPDVVFLDIQMPGVNGVEAAQILLSECDQGRFVPPVIVFTTAFDRYAVDAFQVGATDYLLKPYDIHRLHACLQRVERMVRGLHVRPGEEGPRAAALSLENVGPEKLLIDEMNRTVLVSLSDIYYAVRTLRTVDIYTATLGVLQSKWTLHELEDKLPNPPFFRPHRSYLVNLRHVLEVKHWQNGAYNAVLDAPGRPLIPVSRALAKMFFQKLEEL